MERKEPGKWDWKMKIGEGERRDVKVRTKETKQKRRAQMGRKEQDSSAAGRRNKNGKLDPPFPVPGEMRRVQPRPVRGYARPHSQIKYCVSDPVQASSTRQQ